MRLRFGLHLLPFRISLERGPIFLPFLTAGMLQNVNEQVLRIRRILGRPITDALHVVPLEDRIGMIAEAILQRLHFTFVDVIEPQFVNVTRGFRFGSAKSAQAEDHRDTTKER